LGNIYSYRFKSQTTNILLFNIRCLKSWVQELLVADEAIFSKEPYSDRLDPPCALACQSYVPSWSQGTTKPVELIIAHGF